MLFVAMTSKDLGGSALLQTWDDRGEQATIEGVRSMSAMLVKRTASLKHVHDPETVEDLVADVSCSVLWWLRHDRAELSGDELDRRASRLVERLVGQVARRRDVAGGGDLFEWLDELPSSERDHQEALEDEETCDRLLDILMLALEYMEQSHSQYAAKWRRFISLPEAPLPNKPAHACLYDCLISVCERELRSREPHPSEDVLEGVIQLLSGKRRGSPAKRNFIVVLFERFWGDSGAQDG